MNNPWYADFFQGVVVDVWRKAVTNEQTSAEVDALWRWLQLSAGNRVIDVPCGFGRHALELARRGIHMTGRDVSTEMIAAAKRDTAAANLDVDLRVSEMRDLEGLRDYDAGFCFGNSFGYLDRQGMQEFLRGVSQALVAHGRFAFDYGMSAESILPRFTEHESADIDEIHFQEHNRYNLLESRIETTYTMLRDGQTETREGIHWVYTIAEIRQMLANAGLAAVHVFSSLDDEPIALASPVIYMICEKTA